jgi:hypothetical protein
MIVDESEQWGDGEMGRQGEKLQQVFPLIPNSPCPLPMPNIKRAAELSNPKIEPNCFF